MAALALLMAALLWVPARAEEVEKALNSLELDAWQQAADEGDISLDVADLVARLSRGEADITPQALLEVLNAAALGEVRGVTGRLTLLLAPALIWALYRRLAGAGKLGEASGFVCYLAGAGTMLTVFAGEMEVAQSALRRVGALTERIFPALIALLNASGNGQAAGFMGTLTAFSAGAMTAALERIMTVLGGGAAALAVAGNMNPRMPLKGLHRLFCSVGNWLLGGVMAGFLGLATVGNLMGSARDGLTIRAAKYAVDNLLPVVGGDMADTMDAVARSARLVREAAGVTSLAVMGAVCLRPVLRLAMGLVCYRLAAALAEPVAEGPLRACMEQMAQAAQLMLVAVAVSMAIFATLAGVALSAGRMALG